VKAPTHSVPPTAIRPPNPQKAETLRPEELRPSTQRQLQFDDAPVAPAGSKAKAPQQRMRGSVVPERRGDQELIAVFSGPLNDQRSEHRPNTDTLQLVRDSEGDMRRRRPRSVSGVASDANDHVPIAVQGCQRIVVHMVEIGEVGKLAGLETRLRREQPVIARLGSKPGEQPNESVNVLWIDRPDLESATVSENEPVLGTRVVGEPAIRCLMIVRHTVQDTAAG
jgi:hypothetical protein